MTDSSGLLRPGAHRAAGVVDDTALVAVIVRVEVAWLRALATVGSVDADDVAAAEKAWQAWRADASALQVEVEQSGTPVLPVVKALRARVAERRLADRVHRGLTSQDVLDTALVLLARDVMDRVRSDLTATAAALADLARTHRLTVMPGRTLTQHAVPITFGLKAARWLDGVLDGRDRLDEARAALPVQCGGAAGTLALVAELTPDPVAAAHAFAAELGLRWPGRPWHTARAPMTRTGDALVTVCDALGVLAGDVALLSRPEIGEVREGSAPGRGASSTMPQKRNPVLSVLVRSAALQAPLLGAQLHLAAAQAVDERPDGAWHSEWPAFRGLLELTVTAASQAAELAAGLEVDGPAMQARARGAAADLLAERGRPGSPADYLGAASEFVDAVLRRAGGGSDD